MFSQTCELLRKYLKERGGPLVPDASSTTISDNNEEMTIFYGGRVLVLENVSYQKANEVMRLAATNRTDVSQMRTRSLSRFLDKRKDRIRATAPYALSHISNKSDDKSWLGLAAANQ